MGIENWSTTPASNNSAPPDGAPEGWAPSAVNDVIRQQMADHRTQWENGEWFNYGHTPTRTGNTTFTVSGDKTTDYTTGRRIKCTDSSTIYGTIVSSSYGAPNTTVTIHSDSGNLSASLTAVALSTSKPTNISNHANYGRKGSDIASATTTDLSAATGDFVDVTGTTTITALGTLAAGVVRTVRFTGILTLTHNGTSLILPGAANITTANGDRAIFRSLGSGNWLCLVYTKASGTAVVTSDTTFVGSKGNDIASATTTDLSAATGDFLDITGTTTITGLGTVAAGRLMVLRFTDVLTFTHDATALTLPTSANITTQSGDVAIMRSKGSGNWLCTSYMKATGKAVLETFSSAATQSDQETATSTTTVVTPGRQQFHPSAAKFWINMNGTGTVAISGSYNVTSITDNGTGDYTITIATDFSNAFWCAAAMSNGGSGLIQMAPVINTLAAGSLRFIMYGMTSSGDGTRSARDESVLCVVGFGDQ